MGVLLLGLVVCLLPVCFGQTNNEDLEYVTRECNSKLRQIDSLEKFRDFMSHYKALVKVNAKPKRGLLNLDLKLRTCYDLEEPLLELERIIAAGYGGVCQLSHIKRLVDFHFRYLVSKNKNSARNDQTSEPGSEPEQNATITKASYIIYFFTLYAHQVSFTCKSKLDARVREAQSALDCSTIMTKFVPSQSDLSARDEGSDLNGQVIDLLDNFKRVENFAPITKTTEMYFDVIIPDAAVDKIEELKRECRVREPYYSALFSPIATLAQIGYSIEDQKVDSDDSEDDDTMLLRCWLITAQLCQGILLTHVTISNEHEIDPELKSKFVSIKLGQAPDKADADQPAEQQEIKFFDKIEEISPLVKKIVKKKFTNMGKIKSKLQSWAKSFIERHIDIESLRKEAGRKYLEALANSDDDQGSKVAFAGRKYDNKKFNPVSVITNDADTFVILSSSFWNREIGILVSSVVAVFMSAVFVWFSLYALVTTLKQHMSTVDQGSFKREWQELRDKRMREMEKKLNKKTPRFSVYKPY